MVTIDKTPEKHYNIYMVNLRANTREAIQDLKAIENDQYPFVLAKSLTRTAQGSQHAVKRETRRRFNLHTNFIPNNIKITAARKSDVKRGTVASDVHTTNKIDFMSLHERGGVKKSRGGKRIAIPSRQLKKRNFKTTRGRVRETWKPKTLLKGRLDRKTGKRRAPGKRAAFIDEVGARQTDAIMRRIGRKKNPVIEVLYILTKRARIKSKWGFERTVKDFTENNFDAIFTKVYNRVILRG